MIFRHLTIPCTEERLKQEVSQAWDLPPLKLKAAPDDLYIE